MSRYDTKGKRFSARLKLGAIAVGQSVQPNFTSALSLEDLSDDIILKVLSFVGPRWTVSSFMMTCSYHAKISGTDCLWSEFWERRCNRQTILIPRSSNAPPPTCHAVAAMWRSISEPRERNMSAYAKMHKQRAPKPMEKITFYPGPQTEMQPISCQTLWRGRLTPPDEYEVCSKDAMLWCDWPGCKNARCEEMCPMSWYMEEEEDDPHLEFLQCSWCSVSLCSEHFQAESGGTWRRCDSCNISVCPDCFGEVLLSPSIKCQGRQNDFLFLHCHKYVCMDCAFAISFEKRRLIRSSHVTSEQFSAAAAAGNSSGDAGLHKRICCEECADKSEKSHAEKEERYAREEKKRLAQLDTLTPCEARTKQLGKTAPISDYAWALGSFQIVLSDGRQGGMCFGINQNGGLSGFLKFPPSSSSSKEPVIDEEVFNFAGLGPAWDGCIEGEEEYQPHFVDGRSDCIEIDAVIAPGPHYKWEQYCNQCYHATLRLEHEEKDGQALLKCEFRIEMPSHLRSLLFFTASDPSAGITSDCTHEKGEIEVKRADMSKSHATKKRKR